MPNPNEGLLPSHVVDLYAAILRDSGLPPHVMRFTVSTVSAVVGQLADAFEAIAPVITAQEAAELMRDMSNAWDHLKETL